MKKILKKNRWHVYILLCKGDLFYTGITTDLERRLRDHQAKKARFTSYNRPVRILYSEPHPDRSSASKREAAIKKLTRREKEGLIREKSKE